MERMLLSGVITALRPAVTEPTDDLRMTYDVGNSRYNNPKSILGLGKPVKVFKVGEVIKIITEGKKFRE